MSRQSTEYSRWRATSVTHREVTHANGQIGSQKNSMSASDIPQSYGATAAVLASNRPYTDGMAKIRVSTTIEAPAGGRVGVRASNRRPPRVDG